MSTLTIPQTPTLAIQPMSMYVSTNREPASAIAVDNLLLSNGFREEGGPTWARR